MDTSTSSATEPLSERRVDQLLIHYGLSHRNPVNERIHMVAIPLIMLSLLGLLWSAHPWLAWGFVAASMVYYARLSLIFTLTMAVVSLIGLGLVSAMGNWALPLSAAIFVAAWIGQFIGHKLEGKKPSFFEDIQYLWVGPLFVVSKLFQKVGARW